MKPVLGPIPQQADRPKAGQVPEKKLWSFSLRYWQQADMFGVGHKDNGWFISLCERLAALSRLGLDEFIKDQSLRDNFRYHEINWAGKNVPVARKDFDWIASDYLDNPDEFPFYQFHVSKALGRVVGFFDETQVFNVVILDPNHNIQPSDYNNYKIRPTKVGNCNYSALTSLAASIVEKCECGMKHELIAELDSKMLEQTGGVVICRIDEAHHERFVSIRSSGHATNISEIFELGLAVYEETYG
ncbi:hypothetical protein C241_19462 [Bradyrhizobium lupini HPC(L)]|uniref:Uncharacterized protein n=1 Tax=Bradyrhizobium lupini HPC(L) TaxID=1229491 RepID=A0ABN0HII6_RHILU|nr:hypothetical protein C241_19462 [Bradyrhizobium lupini HPC(L)]